jgi:hypothetical protein
MKYFWDAIEEGKIVNFNLKGKGDTELDPNDFGKYLKKGKDGFVLFEGDWSIVPGDPKNCPVPGGLAVGKRQFFTIQGRVGLNY